MSRKRTISFYGRSLFVVVALLFGLEGCKKKVTQAQCDELIDHFADLIAHERYADAGSDVDASPAVIAAEQARAIEIAKNLERQEAKNVDELKNCTSEVQANEYDCAMKSKSSNAMLKCLE